MSDAPAGTAWQQPELAGEYLEIRRSVVPLLDVQEALVRTIFQRHGRPIRRFVDIGAGGGAMSELLLGLAPQAEAVLVDYSEPMLRGAADQLANAPGSWRIAHGDLREAAWRAELEDASFDAAVSGLAIHHLDSRRKRELFAEVFDLLAPGAMFVNMDVVVVDGPLAGLFDEELAARAAAHGHEHGAGQGGAGQGAAAGHGEAGDDGTEGGREPLGDDSDDRPDRAEEQLQWLRDAGFVDVELHFKWAEGAIFGATKPLKGGT